MAPASRSCPWTRCRRSFAPSIGTSRPIVYDGHNIAEVLESFDWVKSQRQWPVAVIYKTHKGRGVSFMEDNAQWHGAVIDDATYAKARQELLQTLQKLEELA